MYRPKGPLAANDAEASPSGAPSYVRRPHPHHGCTSCVNAGDLLAVM